MIECPECDKLLEIKDESQKIGEFIEWLSGKGLVICKWMEEAEELDGYYPYHFQIEQLLAEFFDIDLDKVEEERRKLLESLR